MDYLQRGTIYNSSNVIQTQTFYLNTTDATTTFMFGFKYRAADNYGGLTFYFYNVTSALIAQAQCVFINGSVYINVINRQNNLVNYQSQVILINQWYWVAIRIYHEISDSEYNKIWMGLNDKPFTLWLNALKQVAATYNTSQYNPVWYVHHFTIALRGLFIDSGPNTIVKTSTLDIDWTPFYVFIKPQAQWNSVIQILSSRFSNQVFTFNTVSTADGFIVKKIGMTLETAIQQEALEFDPPTTSSSNHAYSNVTTPNTSATKLSNYVKDGFLSTGSKMSTTSTSPVLNIDKIGVQNLENLAPVLNGTSSMLKEVSTLVMAGMNDKFKALFATGLTEASDTVQDGIKTLAQNRHVDFTSWISTYILSDLSNNIHLKTLLENWVTGSSGLAAFFSNMSLSFAATDLNIEGVTNLLLDPTGGLPIIINTLIGTAGLLDMITDLWNLFINQDSDLWSVLLDVVGTKILDTIQTKLLDKAWIVKLISIIFSLFDRISSVELY